MTNYIYDQAWQDEKRRLDALAAIYDEGSIRCLEQVGVGAGETRLKVVAAWAVRPASTG